MAIVLVPVVDGIYVRRHIFRIVVVRGGFPVRMRIEAFVT